MTQAFGRSETMNTRYTKGIHTSPNHPKKRDVAREAT